MGVGESVREGKEGEAQRARARAGDEGEVVRGREKRGGRGRETKESTVSAQP